MNIFREASEGGSKKPRIKIISGVMGENGKEKVKGKHCIRYHHTGLLINAYFWV